MNNALPYEEYTGNVLLKHASKVCQNTFGDEK